MVWVGLSASKPCSKIGSAKAVVCVLLLSMKSQMTMATLFKTVCSMYSRHVQIRSWALLSAPLLLSTLWQAKQPLAILRLQPLLTSAKPGV